MSDEDQIPGMTVEFGEDDFDDDVLPDDVYDAEIAFCQFRTRPEDRDIDPGDRELAIGYRIDDETKPELKGRLISDWAYNIERNKNRKAKAWLKWMGYNPGEQGFSFNADDVKGLKVKVKTKQKMVGKGADRHAVNTVVQVWRD